MKTLKFILQSTVLLVFSLNSQAYPSTAGKDFVTKGEQQSMMEVMPSQPKPGQPMVVRYYPTSQLTNASIHYGFNGWHLGFSDGGESTRQDEIEVVGYRQKRMRWQGGCQCFEVSVEIPLNARSFHNVFFWKDDKGGTQWDNNYGRDFSWPIVFPYIGPYLTLDTASGESNFAVVNFVHSVARPGYVEYWQESGGINRVDGAPATYHHIRLQSLKPGETYHYRVGVEEGEFVSKEYSFTMPPAPKEAGAVSFIVFGDSQDNGNTTVFADLSSDIASNHPDATLVVSTGDLSQNDGPGDWWTFFDRAKSFLATKFFIPVPGNHDTPDTGSNADISTFTKFFPLPYGRTASGYYTIQVGRTQFFAMNSEDRDQFSPPGGEQYTWLSRQIRNRRTQIRSNPQSQSFWTFTLWHHPPVNLGVRHFGEQFYARGLVPLFDGIIDWHFGGHEHLYQRMDPMVFVDGEPSRRSEYGVGAGQGTGYIVVPPAGPYVKDVIIDSDDRYSWYRDLLAYPQVNGTSSQVASKRGYIKISMDGAHFDMQTYGRTVVNGNVEFNVVDSLSYEK